MDEIEYYDDCVGAIYVHVPFCRARCAYCDFPTSACSDRMLMRDYVAGVEKLVERAADAGLLDHVRTAYIGGGTPTLLGAELLSHLIATVRAKCPEILEFTFEANPDSATAEVFAAAKQAGATRVSIGVQSFAPELLAFLGRVHDAEQAKAAIANAKAAGLDVSVDLICGIPGQTDAQLAASVETALDLGVDHLSCYPLMIEEGTPLYESCEAGRVPWPSDDDQAVSMECAEHLLEARGFHRYEVASYAKPGKECRHNLAYWSGGAYLGIGHAAASMAGTDLAGPVGDAFPGVDTLCDPFTFRLRFTCTSPAEGIAAIGRGEMDPGNLEFETEELSWRDSVAEDLMLGARKSAGVDKMLADLGDAAFGERYRDTVDGLARDGLITVAPDGSFKPTEKGWLLGNIVYGDLWELASDVW
jgi:oxygen-independent coproporphyrinogen-3 oxidase